MSGLAVATIAAGVIGFIWWYSRQVKELNTAAAKVGEVRVEKIKALVDERSVLKQPAKPLSPVQTSGPGRKTAPEFAEIGETAVSVASARLGPLDSSSSDRCLSVTLQIKNVSTRRISYKGWAQNDKNVILKDQNGMHYKRRATPPQDGVFINAGETIQDTLLFDPTPQFADLQLDLPVSGTNGLFQFHIPVAFIEKPSQFPSAPVTAGRMPTQTPDQLRTRLAQEKGKAGQAQDDPEHDQKIRSEVNLEYDKGVEKIKRRAQGMSFDRANNYRRTQRKKLIGDLAKKFELEEDQIESILRGQ
jgi:hypothetical protein